MNCMDNIPWCEEIPNILCEVLEGGKLPTKAHATDAGFDLYATEDIVVEHGKVVKHPLNIRFALLPNTYIEITSKSGLGSKGLLIFAGVIDESYRGIPHVVMTNLTDIPIHIKKGDKCAQGIVHPFGQPYNIVRVDGVSTTTSRGEGGFGSSGI